VNSLAIDKAGRLIAGGSFGAARGIAIWDGESWSPFGPRLDGLEGMPGRAYAVAVD
jgi:hypothetical protein